MPRECSSLARFSFAVVVCLTCAVAVASEVSSNAKPKRLPPRAERTPAERTAYFAQLREWYERDSSEWPAPTLDPGVVHRELGPLPKLEHPESNQHDPKKVALGRQLFFDPRLSGSKQIACASCHDPDLGWADGRTTSFGHNRRRLTRNAPSVLNSGHRTTLFWDGRAPSLERQARDVLANADEMHAADEILVENLAAIPEYVESFREAFEVRRPGHDQVAEALAAFQRTIVSTTNRFDRFAKGRYRALNDQELSGLHLFRTDGRCMNCHNGPLFSDDEFHNIGLSQYGRPGEDLGRYEVTGKAEDVGAFRTPSLRDVSRTGPYMHNGLFELDVLLRLYNVEMPADRPRDGHRAPTPIKSSRLKPLGLNKQDLADIAAFLQTLEESRARVTAPDLPPGL